MQQYKRHVTKPQTFLHTITVMIISRVQRAIPLRYSILHSAHRGVTETHDMMRILQKLSHSFPQGYASMQNFSRQLLARLSLQ